MYKRKETFALEFTDEAVFRAFYEKTTQAQAGMKILSVARGNQIDFAEKAAGLLGEIADNERIAADVEMEIRTLTDSQYN